ncbi:MAG: 50S ribosomal protein L14e [Candidatus Altiarchaeota archaeon]|nr:50S ribosomal protein L14e [Candidatus Altiarchaeota archaeon]
MALIDVGRVCRKTRGRDAGGFCVVVDVEKNGVLVDGREVRRRKVNVNHVEPTPFVVELRKGSDTETVVSALKERKLIE